MPQTTPPRRALCRHCRKFITITKGDRFRMHNGLDLAYMGSRFYALCEGSGTIAVTGRCPDHFLTYCEQCGWV